MRRKVNRTLREVIRTRREVNRTLREVDRTRRKVNRMLREVDRMRREVDRTRRKVNRMRRKVNRTRRKVRCESDWALRIRGSRRSGRGRLADEMEDRRAHVGCHHSLPARLRRKAATQLQHAATTIQKASEAFPDVTAAWNPAGLLGGRIPRHRCQV